MQPNLCIYPNSSLLVFHKVLQAEGFLSLFVGDLLHSMDSRGYRAAAASPAAPAPSPSPAPALVDLVRAVNFLPELYKSYRNDK